MTGAGPLSTAPRLVQICGHKEPKGSAAPIGIFGVRSIEVLQMDKRLVTPLACSGFLANSCIEFAANLAHGTRLLVCEGIEPQVELCGGERLLSGSDDFTLFLWRPLAAGPNLNKGFTAVGILHTNARNRRNLTCEVSKTPVCRMTGHQKIVCQVSIASERGLMLYVG